MTISYQTKVAGAGMTSNGSVKQSAKPVTGLLAGLHLYITRQASTLPRYCLEQLIFLLVGWIPTIVGVGLRALCYRHCPVFIHAAL